ncbi:MAG: cupin domain-containing protein [Chitinophagales bacterium]
MGGEELQLKGGDSVFIEAGRKHRVIFTSKEPPCIWLAVHF